MHHSSSKYLVIIAGPTGVGKTALAIQLANRLSCEIISADSRQFFKELNIGTAKPTGSELAQVKHHFINSHSILEQYDAAAYGKEAGDMINLLFKTYNINIVVGGSGLYIRGLLEGFDEMPEIPEGVRQELTRELDIQGLDPLLEELKEKDPNYFGIVDLNNPQRILRALEVIRHTGKTFSEFRKGSPKTSKPGNYSVIKVGLEMDRTTLYKRIDRRMDDMIAAGLFEEAQELKNYSGHNALQTVGYKEIFDYLDGKYDREEAIRLLKRNSRRYAKRQLTWFKRDEEYQWFTSDDLPGVMGYLKTCMV